MDDLPLSRRDVTRAPITAPVTAAVPDQAITASPDADLFDAWNERQMALARIEERGNYYHCETHSPADAAIVNHAEERIIQTDAVTTRGVLIKLWVAFSFMGGVWKAADRARHDAIRRAEIAEVETYTSMMDCEERAVFNTVKSLTAIVEARHG